VGGALFGSQQLFSWNREPYHATNFLTVHDGFTLYDLESFDAKVNGCGPLDPACCPQTPGICDEHSGEDHNISHDWHHLWNVACAKDVGGPGTPAQVWFEGTDLAAAGKCGGTTWQDDGSDGSFCPGSNTQKVKYDCYISDGPNHDFVEGIKRKMMRNMFAQLLLAHGTPLVLGGDEWMRTQLGNNNAYSTGADNPYNWFAWGEWSVDLYKVRMHDFVRQLTALRARHADQLAPADWVGSPSVWRNEQGAEPADGAWGGRHMALYYTDGSRSPPLYIIINGEDGQVDFQLPPEHAWARVIDTQDYFDEPSYFGANALDPTLSANAAVDAPAALPGSDYNTPAHTVVVLEAVN
jgi:pullulanase/glycogen debranching enzyme